MCQSTAEEDGDPFTPSTTSLPKDVHPVGEFFHSYTEIPAAISEHLLLLHMLVLWILPAHTYHAYATQTYACLCSFYVSSSGPATPLKHLSPASFTVGANLSLSPDTLLRMSI